MVKLQLNDKEGLHCNVGVVKNGGGGLIKGVWVIKHVGSNLGVNVPCLNIEYWSFAIEFA